MRTSFDLTPFRRSTVGFDRLFDLLESGPSFQPSDTYPPFDLEREGDGGYRITMAVAGFKEDEIDMTVHQNQLIITGKKTEEDQGRFIHRGIATRSFERRFALGDYVEVTGADLADGLLTITLRREVPEAMKPRRIDIGGNHKQISDQRGGSKPDKDHDRTAA